MVLSSENMTISIENEAQCSEFDEPTQKQSKKLYTRDFLLSLRESGLSKGLPGGFKSSTLCEFDDASTSIFDIQKATGSVLSHTLQGSQSGSSSPTRRDSGNSSRGSVQKQEVNPSGWNNQDSRSQCDRDSGDGSHYGLHSQYYRQSAGRNGFLGSDNSPSMFQCTAGTLAPKVEARVQYELRKSNNPYRPPHSYKAAPKPGMETELCTKEPTSSSKCLNEGIAKEEKTEAEGSDDSCVPQISMEGNTRNYEESCQTLESNVGIGFQKDFESDEVPLCVQSISGCTISGIVTSKLSGFPFPLSVADNNFLLFGDGCRSAVINSEGIKGGNFSEITEVDNTQVNQSYDDNWAEIVSMLRKEQDSEPSAVPPFDQISDSTIEIHLPDENSLITIDDTLILQEPKFMPEIAPNLPLESKLNLVPDSNESASEYCLPDEDSLISIDDLMIPQHSVSASSGNSLKDCMLPSNVTTEVLPKYLAQNVVHQDGRSTVPGYCGVTSPQNFYPNQDCQLSYPSFCHSQMNSGLPSFHALYAHQAQINSQTIFMDPKTTCLPLKHHFDAQCRPSGSKAKSKKLNLSSCHSVSKQPRVPPRYLQHELFIGPSRPHYVAQMTSHAQGLNPMQTWPSNYQPPSYGGFSMPNSDPGGGVGYNNQVSYHNFIKTNLEQICHGGSKQLGQGFWWGH